MSVDLPTFERLTIASLIGKLWGRSRLPLLRRFFRFVAQYSASCLDFFCGARSSITAAAVLQQIELDTTVSGDRADFTQN